MSYSDGAGPGASFSFSGACFFSAGTAALGFGARGAAAFAGAGEDAAARAPECIAAGLTAPAAALGAEDGREAGREAARADGGLAALAAFTSARIRSSRRLRVRLISFNRIRT